MIGPMIASWVVSNEKAASPRWWKAAKSRRSVPDMYLPTAFALEDPVEIEAFMRRHDFATMVGPAGARASGSIGGDPEPDGGRRPAMAASHLPLHLRSTSDGWVLEGHLARANPHWQAMDGTEEFLVVFSGPHGYVSPTWYGTRPAVPTWNYAVIHAHGKPRVRPDDADFCRRVLGELVRRYEAGPGGWRLEDQPDGFIDKLLPAIVGFEMSVERVEAKFKLGQNRSAEDRAATVAGLERVASPEAAALADLMRRLAG
jgi:transcriptional regulator